MRIVLETLDGTKYEAQANAETFGCLADRVAFERRFGVSAAVLSKVEQFVDRSGDAPTISDPDGLYDVLREEHILFLAWRELARRTEVPGDFDEVLANAAGLTMDGGLEATAPVDPSRQAGSLTTG